MRYLRDCIGTFAHPHPKVAVNQYRSGRMLLGITLTKTSLCVRSKSAVGAILSLERQWLATNEPPRTNVSRVWQPFFQLKNCPLNQRLSAGTL